MILLNIIAAVLFSYYFIAIAGIPYKIKSLLKLKAGARIKPLDCMTCLSAWSALALYFCPDPIIYCFIAVFGSGYIGSKFKI